MNVQWDKVLLSYLHDPPDKVLSIRDHESRAAAYASKAFGRPIGSTTLHGDTRTEDVLSSVADRIPFPSAGRDGERAVGPDESGRLVVRHPLSGAARSLRIDKLDLSDVESIIAEIVSGAEDDRDRVMRLWRFYRNDLDRRIPGAAALPSDTWMPDASIWNHLDISAGLRAAMSGEGGYAFLSFALSPVQSFIAASRGLRDLWSGSYILAWLTFKAMVPVLETVGPMSFVFPNLRGMPMVDHWLQQQMGSGIHRPDPQATQLRTPSLPNRFLAVVPAGEDGAHAAELARTCEFAARAAWKEMAENVRSVLKVKWSLLPHSDGWDDLWDEQIDTWFDMVAVAIPERKCDDALLGRLIAGGSFDEAFPDAAKIRRMEKAIPETDRPGGKAEQQLNRVGHWQAMVELAGRTLAARRAVRSVPSLAEKDRVPQKCSLLGTYEQMGPADLDQSRDFWEAASRVDVNGVRIRSGERFSAVALVKRFAWPAHIAPQLGLDEHLRYPDTATVAAAEWLERAGIDPDRYWRKDNTWSGQWLHWPTPVPPGSNSDERPIPKDLWLAIQAAKNEHGQPPAYYAVLNLDGDHMGKWLKGENSPSLGDLVHPKLKAYFDSLPDDNSEISNGLKARRPVGPALHAAISEALTNFALSVVPHIVEKHSGTLVYSGGDDVLALLPTRTAIACARELNLAFQGNEEVNDGADPGYYRTEEGRDLLTMGGRASTSAGIAVVHYKEDLRYALEQARQAEKQAKNSDRNALAIRVCRRSGEHAGSVLPWSQVKVMESWIQSFIAGSSDRWAYDARRLHPTLGYSWPMMKAEIQRLMQHREDNLKLGLRPEEFEADADKLMDDMRKAVKKRREKRVVEDADQDSSVDMAASKDLITTVQSASFLARGRDE